MRLWSKVGSADLFRALAVCAVFVLPAADASAASCSSLQAELRRLESGSASQSPAAQKWTSAKARQQEALTAAQRDAGYLGCANSSTPECKSLNGKIKQMKTNLAAIERQLAKSGGGSSASTGRLRQIKASLASQNCNAPARAQDARSRTDEGQPRSLLSRLFGGQSQQPRQTVSARSGDPGIRAVRSQHSSSISSARIPTGGTFRTLCVRTCDGYFFPLSFSTGKNHLPYDEARCSEICPAAPTELYVYRNPGGDRSQMISLAGKLYSEQPFANRYKAEFVQGCSCRAAQQSKSPSSWKELSSGSADRVFFADISSGLPRRSLHPSRGATFEESGNTPSPLSGTPLERAHLPPYEDPDTRFNLEKGFDVAARLSDAAKRLKRDADVVEVHSTTDDGLPLLSTRTLPLDGDAELASVSPVFKSEDPGFRPAEDRKAPVRVVGPEYFVAQ
ncbi:DUF2865 domain-containing protein [Roseibium salinum]|uniref:DUF2865 domain-containing protein n=1 Tax=Roseibium salinum TaxID=1604349 RepID=A0ABT3R242_9HYPH|nr:DUF2865 domain-containing protein [Roseibium sp. DSM 29163]MCX2723220.1 DUF2865 domain-containing protein [Roseibium sp. DSM 29163]